MRAELDKEMRSRAPHDERQRNLVLKLSAVSYLVTSRTILSRVFCLFGFCALCRIAGESKILFNNLQTKRGHSLSEDRGKTEI